jgi:hypothetical protein
MPASQRPPFPSAPSEPSLRRLGVGGPGGGGERPLRAQLVVALVVGLILLAVPLYLWRRPRSETGDTQAAVGPADASVVPVRDAAPDVAAPPEKPERVRLGPVQRVKCSASRAIRGQEGALCDALPFFEKALAESIIKNVACAPRLAKTGSINYVLQINFRKHWLNVFPGASGQWRGPKARRAVACVERSLKKPDWDKITHQYSYYMIAIMASYSPESAIPGPSRAPVFE